ncbi:hypothetical protein K492DRAFT_173678, partial [Lichtheimia hyalospora FSU 10163]
MSTAPASSLPSWLAWYLAQLASNPLRTKAITNSVLAANQEAAAQKLSGSKSIDKRVLQMAAYGLLIAGPLNHFLYEIMGKLLAGKPAKQAKIGQLLFSNFIISPTMNSIYISVMTILAGARSFDEVKKAWKNGILSMQKVSWCVSPCSMIFAQNFIPQFAWVPFFNLTAFFVGTYLNTMIKKKRMEAAKKEGKEQ